MRRLEKLSRKAGRKWSTVAGFSAVELLATMSVVGIVASIAIPHYVDYTRAARAATCSVTRDSIRRAAIHYMNGNDLKPGAPLPTLADLVKDGQLLEIPECPSNGIYVWIDESVKEGKTPELGCSIHYWPSQAAAQATSLNLLYFSDFDSMDGLKQMTGVWKSQYSTLVAIKGGRISFGSPDWSDFKMTINSTNLKGNGYDIYYRGSLEADGRNFQTGYRLRFDPKKDRLQVRPIVNSKVLGAIASYSLSAGFPARGQAHDIGVSVQGSGHTISVDGQAVVSFTDDRYSSGMAGLGSGRKNNRFNSVIVTAQPG